MSNTDRITEELKKANITEAILAELKNFLPITVSGEEDIEAYNQAKEAKKVCVKVRTSTQKLCKKGREDAIAEQKAWIAKEKEIVAEVGIVEAHLDAQIKVVDDAIALKKEMERRKSLLPERRLRVEPFAMLTDDELLDMDDNAFNDMMAGLVAEAEKKKAAEKEKLRQERMKQLADIGLFYDGKRHYRGNILAIGLVDPLESYPQDKWEQHLAKIAESVSQEIKREEEEKQMAIVSKNIDSITESPAKEDTVDLDNPYDVARSTHKVTGTSTHEPKFINLDELSHMAGTANMEGIKHFFFDVETTGVLPNKHGIHQLSGSIWVDGECKERFNFKVQPNPLATIDPEALKVGNVTEEQIKAYPPMGEVYKQLIEMLSKYVDKFNKKDKFFLVGYNNRSFDDQFLRGFFKQNGDDYFGSWFWSDSHDVLVMASVHLSRRRAEMENFKLATVAAFMGIEVSEDKLHDASYDIHLTEQLYLKLNA